MFDVAETKPGTSRISMYHKELQRAVIPAR
jgi:hypothetical protein